MEDSSAVFLLDSLLSDAMARHCTDVHLLCQDQHLRVLLRLNGHVVPYLQSHHDAQALLRRIKALAGMDLALNRVPAEGTFRWSQGEFSVNVRVSLVPTPTGDSVVLRLLHKDTFCKGLTALGMTVKQTEQLTRIVSSGQGLVLVAGATGSGKTTTLYTLLQELAMAGRCVVSIEDPVEVPQAEFVQLEVREQLGLTFAKGLKSLLRQDPDVIMVGEIRDEETAHLVLNAALTGHLVVSTTHASNLTTALVRLSEFGLSVSLLAAVFQAIIVQRQQPLSERAASPLVHSRTRMDVPIRDSMEQGKIVFELHEMTPDLHHLLTSNLPWHALKAKLEEISSAPADRPIWRIGG